ncbi:MAG TPA: DUF4440 domain-containing protein [Candidatus Binatia bacterium]|nr:DUF4440 domain-containing protein [Candidatus Binatia bacterium]
MAVEEQLVEIERKLWTNDAAYYRDNLIEETVLVFPETGVILRDAAVEAILSENANGQRWAEVEFADVKSRRLSDDVVLLTYRVAARWEHEESRIFALASSLYVKRNDRWKLAFHQQTPIEGG